MILMAEPDTRRTILEAAQAVFLDKGYGGATIADIRARSGASTGSIYHFFKGKEAIATALFLEAVAGWSAATERARKAGGAEAQIRASVEGLVTWGLADPRAFRILDELRFLEPLLRRSPDMAAALDAGSADGERVYQAGVEAGAVRPLPWPIARAAMLGPAYDYLRLANAGRAKLKPQDAMTHLSDIAWNAVRAP
jgi:AcrR family transcriptional regulator